MIIVEAQGDNGRKRIPEVGKGGRETGKGSGEQEDSSDKGEQEDHEIQAERKEIPLHVQDSGQRESIEAGGVTACK